MIEPSNGDVTSGSARPTAAKIKKTVVLYK
jgi:hypothetical protein